MKSVCILVFTTIVLFGCSKDNPTEVRIRVANISQFDFQNIVVASTTFEDVKSGQRTNYKVFESAYRYAFIALEIEGNIHTIQPYDFVGETLLENGNYTYQINADDSQERYGKLSLTLAED